MLTREIALQNKEGLRKGSGDELRLPSETQVSDSLFEDNSFSSKQYEHTPPSFQLPSPFIYKGLSWQYPAVKDILGK